MQFQRPLASRAMQVLALALAALMLGCQAKTSQPDEEPSQLAIVQGEDKFRLTSPAFDDGQPIPKQYTADGADVSPPLEWTRAPAGTKQFALVCEDPDAPRPDAPRKTLWIHWLIYKIPAGTRELAEGVERNRELKTPAGAVQGRNSWPTDNIGYRGPQPPAGRHRYFFRLYALDTELALEPGAARAELAQAMRDHTIGTAVLIGTYKH
jgi:Raf kinase inhibitor-like YbhB/YbcL family protein